MPPSPDLSSVHAAQSDVCRSFAHRAVGAHHIHRRQRCVHARGTKCSGPRYGVACEGAFISESPPVRAGCHCAELPRARRLAANVRRTLFSEMPCRRTRRDAGRMHTGVADVPMTVRAMKAGAVDVLPKPVRSDPLVDAIQHALAQS